MSYLPLVGLPADTHENHGFLFHSIGDKYTRAVAEAANCAPVKKVIELTITGKWFAERNQMFSDGLGISVVSQ